MLVVALGELGLTRRLLPERARGPGARERSSGRYELCHPLPPGGHHRRLDRRHLRHRLPEGALPGAAGYVAVVGSMAYGALVLGAYGLGLAAAIALCGFVLLPASRGARFSAWLAARAEGLPHHPGGRLRRTWRDVRGVLVAAVHRCRRLIVAHVGAAVPTSSGRPADASGSAVPQVRRHLRGPRQWSAADERPRRSLLRLRRESGGGHSAPARAGRGRRRHDRAVSRETERLLGWVVLSPSDRGAIDAATACRLRTAPAVRAVDPGASRTSTPRASSSSGSPRRVRVDPRTDLDAFQDAWFARGAEPEGSLSARLSAAMALRPSCRWRSPSGGRRGRRRGAVVPRAGLGRHRRRELERARDAPMSSTPMGDSSPTLTPAWFIRRPTSRRRPRSGRCAPVRSRGGSSSGAPRSSIRSRPRSWSCRSSIHPISGSTAAPATGSSPTRSSSRRAGSSSSTSRSTRPSRRFANRSRRTALLLLLGLVPAVLASVLLVRRMLTPTPGVAGGRGPHRRRGVGPAHRRPHRRRDRDARRPVQRHGGAAPGIVCRPRAEGRGPDARGRGEEPRAGAGEPAQERVPGQHVARAADAAQRDHRLLRGAARSGCSAS